MEDRRLILGVCPAFSDIWLDRGEFGIMTAESTVYRKSKLTEEYRRPSLKSDFKYLSCVRCGKLMNRENFKKISGVMIDRCGNHGVWLDAGGLEKIRHFIADGGLDDAQDLERERNRQELKDLATTVTDTAFTQRLIHFGTPKRWFFRGW